MDRGVGVTEAAGRAGAWMRAGAAALLVLACWGCGAAGETSSGRQEGSIVGRVVDDEGAGVAGIAVSAFRTREVHAVGRAWTEADGTFRLAVEGHEPFDVRAGRAAVADDDCWVWWSETAEALDVRPGGEPLRLVLGGREDGRVRVELASAAGDVVRAWIRAVPTFWPREVDWWWRGDWPDEQGRLEIEELPRFPVELRVFREPPWCPVRGPVVLPDPVEATTRRIEMERARVVEGTVLDRRGAPVAACGVMVLPRHVVGAQPWGDLTGPDGRFAVGVPESWTDAELLVGCDEPAEATAFRKMLEIEPASVGHLRVHLDHEAKPAFVAAGGEEVRRVIEAVLRAHYLGTKTQSLLLRRELDELPHERDPATYLGDGIHVSTIRDLQRQLSDPGRLPSGLDVGARVPVLVLEPGWWAYLEEVHRSAVWKHLHGRYPDGGGWLMLSPVGFSEDGTQAVVHVAHVQGYLCGRGHYHLLEKHGEVWRVARRAGTWIS